MRVYCITINNFYLIPVTRYFLRLFASRFHVEITECYISGQYETAGVKKYRAIGKFENFGGLSNQSMFFKLWKYLFINIQLAGLLMKPALLFYTPDWQVAALLFWYKKVFKKKGWRIIYHQFELVEEKQLSGGNKKTWRKVLDNSHLADLLIFPEKHRMDYYQQHAHTGNAGCMVFPNTCETAEANPPAAQALEQKIPRDALVIGHIGNVGPNHYLQQFINIIEACSSENIYFVLAGRYAPEVMDVFNSVRNPKFIYLGALPHQQLAAVYARIDIGFILYKGVDLNFEYCAPNKLYEYWSHGIPVIAHRLTGLKSVFDATLKGKLLDFDSGNITGDAVNAIKTLKPNKATLRSLFAETLAIDTQLTHFAERLKQIVQ